MPGPVIDLQHPQHADVIESPFASEPAVRIAVAPDFFHAIDSRSSAARESDRGALVYAGDPGREAIGKQFGKQSGPHYQLGKTSAGAMMTNCEG